MELGSELKKLIVSTLNKYETSAVEKKNMNEILNTCCRVQMKYD
jgi:hypothetical protein